MMVRVPLVGDLIQTTAGTWIVRAPTHCPCVIYSQWDLTC
jgi:hypothetical protein